MNVNPWDQSQYGKFYSGDAYIILQTIQNSDGSFEWHVFFWLGKDSSQDEQGVAAYATVDLDDTLGGAPVQHREVQGHESAQFTSVFKDMGGVQYLEGGIESGFNHVEPDKYEPRLFQVKGKRDVRVVQVERKASSLNHGDAFILDMGLKLFQWNGAEANKYEKFKALEFINKLNNEERGARAEVFFFDEAKSQPNEEKEFWTCLGGSAADVAPATPDDQPLGGPRQLIRVSDASGTMKTETIAQHKLLKEMLDPNDVFIVDTGSELFVWVGKGATKEEKRQGMGNATKYLSDNNRPSWVPVTRVVQGAEPPAFQSQFADWTVMAPPKSFAKEYKAKEKQADFNVSTLYAQQHPEEEKMVDDGTGTIEVWRVEDFDKVPVESNMHGQFYAGDSYVILYTYFNKQGKKAWIIYFWQGRDSSQDEKASAAMLARDMDDALGGDPVQVRVVMGKEPNHFLTLFKGRFIVHEGGRASGFKNRDDTDSYDTDGISLFHVKGTTALNTKAIQVAEKAVSLNSGDCFVLLTPGTMFVWQGKGSNDDEKKYAGEIANILKGSRSVETVAEGSEPAAFWDALGGKTEYASSSDLEAVPKDPRLFHMSNASGEFNIEEVFNFTQDDLLQDDIFMLDVFTEIYVWVGADSNKLEKDMGFKAALDYVANVPDGRDPDTPVLQVSAGAEPPMFTQAFVGWDYGKASNFEDPYEAALAAMKNTSRVSSKDIGYRPFSDSLPLSQLTVVGAVDNLDNANREQYLSASDFQTVFGMAKDAFNKLPGWKKANLKKQHKLF
jgi:hypothetical protein